MLLPLLLLQASIKLYPTVGLQTPGELIEANFGTKPFLFDFASMLKVVCVCVCERACMHACIYTPVGVCLCC